MGSGEKKLRREINRVLNKFALHEGESVYPLRNHLDARDMVVEFAAPLDGLFDTLTTRYSIAVFAWNLSLVDEGERAKLTEEFLAPLLGEHGEGRAVIAEVIDALTLRRLDLYPQENFLILPSEAEGDESLEEDDEGPIEDDGLLPDDLLE